MSSADVFDDDPHGELGVDVSASLQDIKKAYRRLAAKWHPDRNTDPQAVWRMQRINQAYQKLCEWWESDRAEGDESPPADHAQAERRAEPEAHTEPDPAPKAKRAWWERNWGHAKWEPDGQVQPETIRDTVTVTLEAAAKGCTHQLKGFITDLCAHCHGVGHMISPRSDCDGCGGEGRVQAGASKRWKVCGDCGGDGVARQACTECGGSGRMATPRAYHFEVRLPAGLMDRQVIVLRGQGQRCADLSSDIELTVHIQPHPYFRWTADGVLACTVPVDVFAEMLQEPVEVPTLDGHRAKVSLADGPVQRLAGLGYPQRDGQPGPLEVHFEQVWPQQLTNQQRDWLRALSASMQANAACSPELAAWRAWLTQRS